MKTNLTKASKQTPNSVSHFYAKQGGGAAHAYVIQKKEMTQFDRMIQSETPPNDSDVAAWIGENAFEYWKRVASLIDLNYPNVFVPEWLYGGKKHGWSLRYKKSKSFCTLIPEKDRFAVLVVFGGKERQKIESVKDHLSAATQNEYDKATTYHDGKWVLLTVDSDAVVRDLRLLLGVKRIPKNERLHNPAMHRIGGKRRSASR